MRTAHPRPFGEVYAWTTGQNAAKPAHAHAAKTVVAAADDSDAIGSEPAPLLADKAAKTPSAISSADTKVLRHASGALYARSGARQPMAVVPTMPSLLSPAIMEILSSLNVGLPLTKEGGVMQRCYFAPCFSR